MLLTSSTFAAFSVTMLRNTLSRREMATSWVYTVWVGGKVKKASESMLGREVCQEEWYTSTTDCS